MRTRLLLSALLAASAGCSDYDLEGDRDVFGVPNPPEVDAPTQQDRIVQTTVHAVDVLWVVDTSCSMAQEQEQLAANFEGFMTHFLDSGLDYHIGVVTTNMDDATIGAGRLVHGGADGSLRYIDNQTAEPIEAFETLVVLGTDGHANERGRDAVFAALDPGGALVDTENAGFYRTEANLAVIVISDEEDYSSNIEASEFIDWLDALKGNAELSSFSSIVGPDGNGDDPLCSGVEAGSDYLQVTRATGGIEWSICSDDWGGALEELGTEAAGLQREFFLSAQPILDTLHVWVERDSTVMRELELDTDYSYNAARNSISLGEYAPEAADEVFIEYEIRSQESYSPAYEQ